MTTSKSWERVGHVEVYIWKGATADHYDFDGLDFKFRISQVLGRMPEGNCSVSICGLSLDTANKIVTLCNVRDALAMRKTVKVYAGYRNPDDPNYRGELIATMDIINASISSPPPDIWLSITAVYAGWMQGMKFQMDVIDPGQLKRYAFELSVRTPAVGRVGWDTHSQTTESVLCATKLLYISVVDVVHQAALRLSDLLAARSPVKVIADYYPLLEHLGLSYNATSAEVAEFCPGKTRRFRFRGDLSDLPTKISETFKVLAQWEIRDDNNIYLAVYGDPRYLANMTDIQKKQYTRPKNIKYLDVNTGLIGIPKLKDAIKLQCRCFLDGRVQVGDYVSVTSMLMPAIYKTGEKIEVKRDGGVLDKLLSDKKYVNAYQIMKITYDGHYRGNQWYCDIEARTPLSMMSNIDTTKVKPIWLTEDADGTFEGWELNENTGDITLKDQDGRGETMLNQWKKEGQNKKTVSRWMARFGKITLRADKVETPN